MLTNNRGNPGDEVIDDQFNMSHPRRGSNSAGHANIADFKSKFEMNDVEPVFEETLHGPEPEVELTKVETASTSGGSTDELDQSARGV